MNALRKRCLKKKWMKPIETAIFALISGSLIYFFTSLTHKYNWCEEWQDEFDTDNDISLRRGWCDYTHYDPLASHFFASEGNVIRNILDDRVSLTLVQITIVFAFWYPLTCITYGTNVPSGLFLPAFIIGCCIGQIYAEIMR